MKNSKLCPEYNPFKRYNVLGAIISEIENVDEIACYHCVLNVEVERKDEKNIFLKRKKMYKKEILFTIYIAP